MTGKTAGSPISVSYVIQWERSEISLPVSKTCTRVVFTDGCREHWRGRLQAPGRQRTARNAVPKEAGHRDAPFLSTADKGL